MYFFFMKKKTNRKGENGKPVTVSQLHQALKPIHVHLEQFDKKIDDAKKEMREMVKGSVDMNRINSERIMHEFRQEYHRKHNEMQNNIDAFIKRTEENEREILFLGHQHDDLAKYCHKKIGYPEYGRKL